MRNILILCALTGLMVTALVWRAVAQPSTFGTFTSAPRADVASLLAKPQDFLDKTVQIEGKITQQCKAMGCFFSFQSGTESLRVDIEDVAMKAPMREGHAARVEGQMAPYNGGYQFSASAVEFK
jgi:uncharacterized protein YdeI (BOF family)